MDVKIRGLHLGHVGLELVRGTLTAPIVPPAVAAPQLLPRHLVLGRRRRPLPIEDVVGLDHHLSKGVVLIRKAHPLDDHWRAVVIGLTTRVVIKQIDRGDPLVGRTVVATHQQLLDILMEHLGSCGCFLLLLGESCAATNLR